MRKLIWVVPSLLVLMLVDTTPAEARGRRHVGARRAAPARRAVPTTPQANVPVPGRRTSPRAAPQPVRRPAFNPHATPVTRRATPYQRTQPVARQPVARPGAARHSAAAVRRAASRSNQGITNRGSITASQRRAAPTTNRAAPSVQLPTRSSLTAAGRARNDAALRRLRGAQPGITSHNQTRHAAPAVSSRRPHSGTRVTSRVDTLRRDSNRRVGSLGQGNLAHHRHATDSSRAALRSLASRSSRSHGVRHVSPIAGSHRAHHRHTRRHVRPVAGSNRDYGLDYYWARHHSHRVQPPRRVIYPAVPYGAYDPYDPYLPYGPYNVPPSPGYQDDAHQEYIDQEYGVAPQPYGTERYEPTPYESGPQGAEIPYEQAPYGSNEAAGPEVAPKPGDEAFARAVEAFRASDFAAARVHLRKAVAANRDDGEAWMALVHATFLLGTYDETAEALAESARLGAFPRGYQFDPRALYEDSKVFDDALAKLHKEAATYPRRVNTWLVRAYFHVAMGETEAATRAIHHVLVLRPRDPTAPVLHTALLPAEAE